MLIKVATVQALPGHRLALMFSDGAHATADLSALIARGNSMVAPLADDAYFARVFLEAGAPTWPNGFDLAPWALHADLKAAGALEPASQSV
jgi:hypothetical protein